VGTTSRGAAVTALLIIEAIQVLLGMLLVVVGAIVISMGICLIAIAPSC
jgi:hypothetical protein